MHLLNYYYFNNKIKLLCQTSLFHYKVYRATIFFRTNLICTKPQLVLRHSFGQLASTFSPKVKKVGQQTPKHGLLKLLSRLLANSLVITLIKYYDTSKCTRQITRDRYSSKTRWLNNTSCKNSCQINGRYSPRDRVEYLWNWQIILLDLDIRAFIITSRTNFEFVYHWHLMHFPALSNHLWIMEKYRYYRIFEGLN